MFKNNPVPKKVYGFYLPGDSSMQLVQRLEVIPDGVEVYSFLATGYKRVKKVEHTLSIPRGERVPA